MEQFFFVGTNGSGTVAVIEGEKELASGDLATWRLRASLQKSLKYQTEQSIKLYIIYHFFVSYLKNQDILKSFRFILAKNCEGCVHVY